MRKEIRIVLVVMMCLAYIAPVKAQLARGDNMLVLQTGGSIPLTDKEYSSIIAGLEDKKIGKLGPAIGAQYLYQLSENIAVGGEFLYNMFSENSYSQNIPAIEFSANVTPEVLTIMPVLKISGSKNVRPYFILGAGYYQFSGERTTLITYPIIERYNVEASCSGIAFVLGGGVDFDIDERTFIGIEGRWNHLMLDKDEVGGDEFNYFNFLVHLGFKFGK